jgi:two-component system response regulator
MRSRTILLVEDNADDEALTLRALKKSNVLNEVTVARDGVEALDYLFATGDFAVRDVNETPAVVLLDLKLPKISGLEVLKRIRTEPVTRLMPVVVLTSSREEQDLFDSYGYGCNSYIRKPVNFDNFVTAISQLGMYWLVLNEPPPPGS